MPAISSPLTAPPATVTPETLLAALADATRLRIALLLLAEAELCVCDLVVVLATHQPKISRHLAHLREQGIVSARREGQWMHYRIHPELPVWAWKTLEQLQQGSERLPWYRDDRRRLRAERHRCAG